MLLSLVCGLTQEMKRNFKHLVLETRPQTCGQMVFKFKKKQAKSKNHKTCLDLMISYMEAMIKIEHVSHNLSCMMFINQSILEQEL